MDLTNFIKILIDKKRLRILNLLFRNEMCVCEISAAMRVSQPLISHHLSVLRRAGIIKMRKIGYWRFFSLDNNGLSKIKSSIISEIIKEFSKEAISRQDLKRFEACRARMGKTKCFSLSSPKLCPHERIFLKERSKS